MIVSFRHHAWAVAKPLREAITEPDEAFTIVAIQPSGSICVIFSAIVSDVTISSALMCVARCNKGLFANLTIAIVAAARTTFLASEPAVRAEKKQSPSPRFQM